MITKDIKFTESVPIKHRNKIERQILEAVERLGFKDYEIKVDEHDRSIFDGDSLPSALARLYGLPQMSIDNAEDGTIKVELYDLDKVEDKVVGYFFGLAKSITNNPCLFKALYFSVGNFLAEKVLKSENHRSAKALIYSISGAGGYGAILLSYFGEISPLFSLIGIPVLYDSLTHVARDILAKREAKKAGYKLSYFE